MSHLGVADLDPAVHLADGSGAMPACGRAFVAHRGESNTTEHLADVTCAECSDLGHERRFERESEAQAAAMTDAEADRYVESRLIGGR